MTYNTTNKGFTLVETLVAISILIVAVVIPLRVVSQAIKSATYNRERLTAVYLAQEGLELMRQKRDNNALATPSSSWSWVATVTNSTNGCGTVSGCSIEPTDNSYKKCDSTSASPCKIYLKSTGGVIYTHSSGGNTATPFSRSINVTSITTPNTIPDRVRVTSTVKWNSSYTGVATEVSYDTWLYNIYE